MPDRPGELPHHLAGLNPAQAEAVRHFEGPLLVVAGAGSGKTRVLTARICHLVQECGVAPARIMAVTFTNKAASEMRTRVMGMLSAEPRGMWIGTFHSIGARLLRRHAPLLGWGHDFTVFDADAQTRLVKEVMKRLATVGNVKPSAVRARISELKLDALDAARYREALDGSVMPAPPGNRPLERATREAFPLYARALKDRNAFDFDDLLLWPVRLFGDYPDIVNDYRERFAFVLVDEYQDTNHPQFRFVEEVGRGHDNVMAVGDPDQSIYAWRGADISNILDFEGSFPRARVITLETNYRSSARILDAANAVIVANPGRPAKTLRPVKREGPRIVLLRAADDGREATWIARRIQDRVRDGSGITFGDCAILYRTNAQSRALESELILRRLPYQIVGGVRFYDRREIQDVLSYLRLIENPADASAFTRAVGYPKRGVGAVSRERVITWASDNEIPVLEAIRQVHLIPGLIPRARGALERFGQLIDRHRGMVDEMSVSELIEALVEDTNLVEELRAEGPEGIERASNVQELVSGAQAFLDEDVDWEDEDPQMTDLGRFLERVSLLADVDRHDSTENSITLMTLHNAKGLEFPVVFITGAEEGLIPLVRSDDAVDQVEEERRLFYVGITRAENSLTISWARRRRRGGMYMDGMLSSFVQDIPEELVKHEQCGWDEGRAGPRSRLRSRYADRRAGAAWRDHAGTGGWNAEGSRYQPEDENQDRPSLIKGARVRHSSFGSGIVLAVTGAGLDTKVEVEFDAAGRKELVVRYAELESDWP